ncbi:MAG: HEAT repeat domain-containing protein [Terriglobales bacterium]
MHLLLAEDALIDAQTMAMLQSHDWRVREAGFWKIKEDKSIEVRKALIALVDRENGVTMEAYHGIGAEYKYGEDYVSYHDQLTQVVEENFNQFHDAAALKVLLHAAYNPDSIFARWLGEQGPDILQYTPEMLKSAVDIDRNSAVAVVAHLISAFDSGKVSLSHAQLEEAHNQLVQTAKNPDMFTRAVAAECLGQAGRPSDITFLRKMAASDPGFDPQNSNYPARDAAVKAIAELQARTHQKLQHP